MSPAKHAARLRQSGFSMIEILVALVILMVGMLGLAGMLVIAQKGEYEAYQRKQALILLQDIVNRFNSNRRVAACYALTASTGTPYLGTGYTGTPVCSAGTLAQHTQAVTDLQEWNLLLQGAAEKSSANVSVGAMKDARGCISVTSTGIYMVTVVWQGNSPTTAPPSSLNCATGLYGVETQRRAVSVTMTVGSLTAI